ncbi:MAG: hypothetical protein N4J56_004159 [Chroococcidiopsis sp. SAG 2025]|uniref:hypothetical protein n=1 Tax=Chroococcidiopsis sp. SAG 2025 TaxID=171389 RepID=UPI0029374813|nr:hypothetical protein [Chroococcidiopsis sp. SAG 2025]MDV2994505.1 hypothetical protein [Chroococcidiopsis sp. SAG 2025]
MNAIRRIAVQYGYEQYDTAIHHHIEGGECNDSHRGVASPQCYRDTWRDSMTNDVESDKAETSMVPEVANSGIMRPPLVCLGAIALGLLLHFA